MKTTARIMLVAVTVALAVALVGCGGGSSSGTPITVTGYVKTYTTTPAAVSGATVTIRGKSATTQADGSFSIAQVPVYANVSTAITVDLSSATPSGQQVNTSPLNHTFTQADITATTADVGTIYTTPAGSPLNQTLLGNVTGFVKNLADGTPVQGAVVTIEGQSDTTDANGAFTIIDVLGPQTGLPVTVDLSSATPADQTLIGSYTADAPSSGAFDMGTIYTATTPPGGPSGF